MDEVDQHTGRASILQMQANNIFPTITADFYSMKSLDDLKDGGHLSDLPEQEKAVLRKKWKLYQKWKEKFGGAIDSKVQDLQRRLKSVETSIEQTEQWLKPYIQTIKQLEGDAEAQVEEMTDPYMIEGYSSSVRGLKIIAHKGVRHAENDDGEEVVTHRDVIVIDTQHISLGGSEQPQAPGQGGEVVIMDFKEYMVCDHVFQEVFQPQIDDRQNEVRRFLHSYTGKDIPADVQEHTQKPYEPYEVPFLTRLKNSVLKWFGGGDEYYHRDPSELRAGHLGPKFPAERKPIYIETKYDIGLYVMK